jgi:hypothetical protein
MSFGRASALGDVRADSVQIARSAVVSGTARLGEGSLLAQGAVITVASSSRLLVPVLPPAPTP